LLDFQYYFDNKKSLSYVNTLKQSKEQKKRKKKEQQKNKKEEKKTRRKKKKRRSLNINNNNEKATFLKKKKKVSNKSHVNIKKEYTTFWLYVIIYKRSLYQISNALIIIECSIIDK
jgi:hypothetical protein